MKIGKLISKKVILIAFIITFLIVFQYNYINNDKMSSSIDNPELNGAVFAYTDTTVNIRVKLYLNADLDTTGRVDGRDLAILAHFFGDSTTTKEYETATIALKADPNINKDNMVDGEDLAILGSRFGLKE